MCGRYDSLIPRDAMEQLFGAESLPASNFPPRYNIAPTQDVPIVKLARGETDRREVTMARWGLVPFWMKAIPKVPHINARAESIERTGLFREAFAARRCLVPATGFYEWEQRGDVRQPYRFRLRSGDPFAFAGLWEYAKIEGKGLMSTTIIVTSANELVGRIHDRMPVILPAEDYATWLNPVTETAEAKALLKPLPADLMESYPVSTIVNHYDNDSEECIRPVSLDESEDAEETGPEQPGLPGL
jgi:putative SOS response-associated peptidase YedK